MHSNARLVAANAAFAGFLLAVSASASAGLPDPYPSTYRPVPSTPVLIRDTTILTGARSVSRRQPDTFTLPSDMSFGRARDGTPLRALTSEVRRTY